MGLAVRPRLSLQPPAFLSPPRLVPQGAVEFLLLAGQMDQAFDIAMGHNEMDTFARIVAASAKPVSAFSPARSAASQLPVRRHRGCAVHGPHGADSTACL